MSDPVRDAFAGRTLLITGGTGSFGNAVLRRLLDSSLAEIRVFSRDEKKQDDMRRAVPHPKLRFYLGDVRDADSIGRAVRGVDFIFHAAALKQVPSCEFFPLEAVRTNVLGASNLLDVARLHGVTRVVMLSTDKAVYPINAMGLTKALSEKLMVATARASSDGPVVCTTRYGNVMNSRGSVIPLFARQIVDGQPLTITDPTMTRFLMTLDESVDLVIHAFQHAEPGDIFVRKAPACTIQTLAEAMQQWLGRRVDTRCIGVRHGEKIYETLLSGAEMLRSTETDEFYQVSMDGRDLDYSRYLEGGAGVMPARAFHDYTSHNTTQLSVSEVIVLLERARQGSGGEALSV